MDALPSVPLSTERGFYIGNILTGILYGIQLSLCFQTIHYLRRRRISVGRARFFTLFSLWTAGLMAIGLACNAVYGQYVWIDGRDTLPGGPGVYFAVNSSWWVNTLGSTSATVTTITSDGLLLYRCIIILNRSILALILPFLLFLAVIAIGILYTVLSALPGAFIFSGQTAQFVVAWTSLSVAFNIVVTLMISIRLILAQRELRKSGVASSSDTYSSIISILVESAFPLAVSGLIAAILYSREHPSAFVFMIIWSFFVGASPQMIILRVAMGKAWSQSSATAHLGTPSTINFHSGTLANSTDSKDERQSHNSK